MPEERQEELWKGQHGFKMNLKPWKGMVWKRRMEIRPCKDKQGTLGGKDILAAHHFFLFESWKLQPWGMLLQLSLWSSSRNWRLVPSRFQCSTVAPDGPGKQSGDYSSGHTGKIRKLWLGDELQPDVQWHRTQLETVQARRQHLGRTSFLFQWMNLRYNNGNQWAFLSFSSTQIVGSLITVECPFRNN